MNKRLIIVFVCMAVFVLTLVVGAVVFSINDVDILLASDENVAFDKTKILDTSGIKKGQSIFTIDKELACSKIEKQFPELKVEISRAFPNKVRIHLWTRTAIFKVQLNDSDKYAILDRELKVVKIVSGGEAYMKGELIPLENYNLNGSEEILGDFIKDDNIDLNALRQVIEALEGLGVTNERIPATFERFEFVTSQKLKMKSTLGITLVINTNANITAKTQCEALYAEFYNMSNDEREKLNFLSYNEYTGKTEVSDKE